MLGKFRCYDSMVNEINKEPLKWSTYTAGCIVFALTVAYCVSRWKRKKKLRELELSRTEYADVKKENEKRNEEQVLTGALAQGHFRRRLTNLTSDHEEFRNFSTRIP